MANKPLKTIKFPELTDIYTVLQATSLAPTYSSTSTYDLDDLVTYDNKLYRCKVKINTAEAWTSSHWTEIDVKEINQSIKNNLRATYIPSYNIIYSILSGQYRQYNYNSIYNDPNSNAFLTDKIVCDSSKFIKIISDNPGNIVVWYFNEDGQQISYEYGRRCVLIKPPINCTYIAFEVIYASASTDTYDKTTIRIVKVEPDSNRSDASCGFTNWNIVQNYITDENFVLTSRNNTTTYLSDPIHCFYGDVFEVRLYSRFGYSYIVYDSNYTKIKVVTFNTFEPRKVEIDDTEAAYIQFASTFENDILVNGSSVAIYRNFKNLPKILLISKKTNIFTINDIKDNTKYLNLNIEGDARITFTNGAYIDPNGNVITANGYSYTDFLEIEQFDYIGLKGTAEQAVTLFSFYDKDKNLVYATPTGYSISDIISIKKIKEFDNRIKYIRLSTKIGQLQVYTDIRSTPIVDISYGEEHLGYLRITDSQYYNDGSTTSIVSSFVSCKVGDVFKYRGCGKFAVFAAGFYDLLGNYISGTLLESLNEYNDITVPKNARNVRFQSYRAGGSLCIDVISPYPIEDKRSVSPLFNKVYYALGDSFTHGDWWHSSEYVFTDNTNGYDAKIFDYQRKMFKTYPWQIMERNGMSPYSLNLATNGRRITDIVANEDYKVPVTCDYLTIRIGLNDKYASFPIGTITDITADTWYGCWNIILDWLTTNRIGVKIGLIIETNALTEDMRNAEIAVAEKYGIAYLDMFNRDDFSNFMGKKNMNETVKNRVSQYWQVKVQEGEAQNGHPSLECHIAESYGIEQFLLGL